MEPSSGTEESKASSSPSTPAPTPGTVEAKASEGEEAAEAPVAPPVKEPSSFTLGNPARVTLAQESVVSFDLTQRYVPVRKAAKPVGIVMLQVRTKRTHQRKGRREWGADCVCCVCVFVL